MPPKTGSSSIPQEEMKLQEKTPSAAPSAANTPGPVSTVSNRTGHTPKIPIKYHAREEPCATSQGSHVTNETLHPYPPLELNLRPSSPRANDTFYHPDSA